MGAEHKEDEQLFPNRQRSEEAFEIVYVTDDVAPDIYAAVSVGIPDFDYDGDGERELNFACLPPSEAEFFDRNPRDILPHKGNDNGTELNAYFTDQVELAIGQYLSYLETHGISKQDAWEFVDDRIPDPLLEDYDDIVTDITTKERARTMIRQAKRKDAALKARTGKTNPHLEKTLEDGCWRDKGLDDEDEELAREIADSIDIDPRSCHWTATNAIKEAWDNDAVEYCEGWTMAKMMGRTIRHAWIEINGSVAEVTWPWHQFDGAEAMYYGTSIPRDVLDDRLDDCGRGAPLLVGSDEYRHL